MKIVQIQFTPWDKIYYFDAGNFELAKGDKVIVKTSLGIEMGEIVGFLDKAEGEKGEISCECPNKEECPHNLARELKPILRKASPFDLEKLVNEEEKGKTLEYCRNLIDKHNLPIKLIDAHFSFDGSKITFAFIADSRIDFRELVKDLTRHFNKTIRLQQIGIRDEAKIKGECGPCGRELCCRGFLRELASITSEMAELQQCAHRGSERLSGVCGRLKCCLAYEQKAYEELVRSMPPLGAKVDVDGKKGVIVGHHILRQSVDVKFDTENGEEGAVLEVDLDRKKTD